MRETVFVTGASSQLGVFLLPRLSAAGFRVLAFSRKAPDDACRSLGSGPLGRARRGNRAGRLPGFLRTDRPGDQAHQQ